MTRLKYDDLKPLVTKQLQLCGDHGMDVIHCYSENLSAYYLAGICRRYLEGHFSKNPKKVFADVDPEMLEAAKKNKIDTPDRALFCWMRSISGIGDGAAKAIADYYKTMPNLIKDADLHGPTFLQGLPLINSDTSIGKAKSCLVHGVLFYDPALVDTEVVQSSSSRPPPSQTKKRVRTADKLEKQPRKRQQQKNSSNKKDESDDEFEVFEKKKATTTKLVVPPRKSDEEQEVDEDEDFPIRIAIKKN
jgi:pyruvate/oxaloacetate carboxyltransferase